MSPARREAPAARRGRARDVELSQSLHALVDRLDPPGGPGRAVQFVAARTGEGVSSIARAFALAAAADGRRTWLVELDVMSGDQAAAFEDGRHGLLGPPMEASPDGSAFLQVGPGPSQARLAVHAVGATGLWVTRFRAEALRPGQKVRITGDGDYWRALRAHADLIVVDAPAAERSRAAAAVAPNMDATLIVVSADNDDPTGPALLRAGLEAVGGRCAGAVLNRAPPPPPRMLRKLTA